MLLVGFWCKICQTLAAGNATINLAVPENVITVTGKLKDYPSTADDGNHMHRTFCPTCGTHLFSEAEERPNIVVVRAGTLDDRSGQPASGPRGGQPLLADDLWNRARKDLG